MEYKLLNKEEYIMYLPQIVKLFKICFNKEIDEKYFFWRYINNRSEDLLAYIAIENENIIANYSIFPCDLHIRGEIKKAALSMTTMTHPDFNGKGIFVTLAEKLYDEMAKRGYEVVFGFPNNNSHRIFVNKLKWKDIYEIPTMNLLVENIKEEKIECEHNIITDNEFELDYSNLFSKNKYTRVEKNNEFLKWRFNENPINKYSNYVIVKDQKVLAYCIIKFYNQAEVDIVETNALDSSLLKILINRIILLNKDVIKKVNTWMSIWNGSHSIYEKMGFTNSVPITYFGARVLGKCDKELLYNYKEWYIQMGDSDVY